MLRLLHSGSGWSRAALFWFAVAALLGVWLRLIPLVPLPGPSLRNLTHGHSHVALMGWLFLGLYGLLFRAFRREGYALPARTGAVMHVALVGMAFTFPVFGYAASSIVFSTVHMWAGYGAAVILWRALGRSASPGAMLAKTALVLMGLSTLSVYFLGPIAASGGRFSPLYQLCIQLFLHLQFNGWLLFGVAALGLKALEECGVTLAPRTFRALYAVLLWACLGTLGAPLHAVWPHVSWVFVNGSGAIGQMFVAGWALRMTLHLSARGWMSALAAVAVWAFAVKAAAQLVFAYPSWIDLPAQVRPFVVGFVHLATVATCSTALFSRMMCTRDLPETGRGLNMSLFLFMAGLALSEVVLALEGLSYWTAIPIPLPFPALLLVSAVLLAGGVLWLLALGEPKRGRIA